MKSRLTLLTAAVATAAVAIPVSNAAAAKSSLRADVSRLDCGSQAVGAGAKACGTVTFTNTGSTSLVLIGPQFEQSSVDFYRSGTTCISSSTLAVGQSCTVDVTFTALGTGRRTAKLVLMDGTLSNTAAVRLVGYGT